MGITWALLAVAITSEVTGTLALRGSHGFSQIAPSVLVVACYVIAFVALSFVLKRGLSVAVAYAIWSAAGILVIAVIDALFLHERFSWIQIVGMATIVVGVMALELGTRVTTT